MNIKKDFDFEIISLFNFRNYSEILNYYRESKQLQFNIIVTNKKTGKKTNINYFMGCGHLTLERNHANKLINISGEYIKEIKNLRINNSIKPSINDIVESIELDIESIKNYTMGEFIDQFGYTATKGIDIYNACVAEYNNLKNTY